MNVVPAVPEVLFAIGGGGQGDYISIVIVAAFVRYKRAAGLRIARQS
ncbi:hypothetical protein [Dysgonomonas termitidis]|uniref:Uncharacterized protein n=1 Tax=Dysgonomonas termitidis TaxID=1516126 RepID=A0ABV9L114_9BACT